MQASQRHVQELQVETRKKGDEIATKDEEIAVRDKKMAMIDHEVEVKLCMHGT